MLKITDYGRLVRISPSLHSQKFSQPQIFRYGQSIFCLPHRPKFSDFFDLFLHWVSVVRAQSVLELFAKIQQKSKYPDIKSVLKFADLDIICFFRFSGE